MRRQLEMESDQIKADGDLNLVTSSGNGDQSENEVQMTDRVLRFAIPEGRNNELQDGDKNGEANNEIEDHSSESRTDLAIRDSTPRYELADIDEDGPPTHAKEGNVTDSSFSDDTYLEKFPKMRHWWRLDHRKKRLELNLSLASDSSLTRNLYLLAFLLSIYLAMISNLVSTLIPIATEPEVSMRGNNLDFGQPLVKVSTLTSLGFASGDYTVSGIDTADNDYLVRIDSINATQVLLGMTHAQAFDLAKQINVAHMDEVGGCISVDASGGLSGANSVVQYSCAAYSTTTRSQLQRWIDAEETVCTSSYQSTDTLFHNCMLFNSHNPGSMYIIAGEATAVNQYDCSYTSMTLYSWDVSTSLTLSSKLMNDHEVECSGDMTTGVAHGFITQQEDIIIQKWPYYSEHFSFEKECADVNSGSLQTLNKWSGDVSLGLYQIVIFCASNGHDDGVGCWDFIFDSLDPSSESWSTWKAFSDSASDSIRNFAANMIQEKIDGTVDYSNKWYEFSEIILAWNTTESGTYFSNSTRSSYTVSYDAFRRTFGWGWDVYPDVIGTDQWEITTDALYASHALDLFPVGTQHTVELRCVGSGSQILDSTTVGDNFRESGTVLYVRWWSKLVNAAMLVISLFLATSVAVSNNMVRFFAYKANGTRRTMSEIYFWIGVSVAIVQGGTFMFESAIPYHLSTPCNMRVGAILNSYAFVIFESFVNRWTVAGLSVALTQIFCWLQNGFGILATGTIPRHIASAVLSVGFFYAIVVGAMSVAMEDACASDVNLYLFDVAFPILTASFATYFMVTCMTHDAGFNLICRNEPHLYHFETVNAEEESQSYSVKVLEGVDTHDDDDDDDGGGDDDDNEVRSDLIPKSKANDGNTNWNETRISVSDEENGEGMLRTQENDADAAYDKYKSLKTDSSPEVLTTYDPTSVLFARPCPILKLVETTVHQDDDDPCLSLRLDGKRVQEDHPDIFYGVYAFGYCYCMSNIVLTFGGAVCLPTFDTEKDSIWPLNEYGEEVDYEDNTAFSLVSKSLMCTGVMSTTASVDLKEASHAKRSSTRQGSRYRLSMGHDNLSKQLSVMDKDLDLKLMQPPAFTESDLFLLHDPWDEDGPIERFQFSIALLIAGILYVSLGMLWHRVLGNFCILIYNLRRVRLNTLFFTAVFGGLDYEGPLDEKNRPHGFGRVHLRTDGSYFFECEFKHGLAHGFGRITFDATKYIEWFDLEPWCNKLDEYDESYRRYKSSGEMRMNPFRQHNYSRCPSSNHSRFKSWEAPLYLWSLRTIKCVECMYDAGSPVGIMTITHCDDSYVEFLSEREYYSCRITYTPPNGPSCPRIKMDPQCVSEFILKGSEYAQMAMQNHEFMYKDAYTCSKMYIRPNGDIVLARDSSEF